MMALEVNKQLIDELIAVAFGHRKFDRVKTHNLCVGADAELEQLEVKAQELDNREKGVVVRESFDGFTCGRCNRMEEYCFNYCPNCGYKLNR